MTQKSPDGLSFKTLNSNAKLEEKLTCGLENGMRNMAVFYKSGWKILKLGLWWDPFVQSRKSSSLKFTEELCVKTMKNDAKFKLKELTYRFKIDMRNLVNFDTSTQNSQNVNFDWFLLCKVYNVWPKKVQRSYLQWHWIVMQNLKKNQLVVWKMAWTIWQIFTRAFENFQSCDCDRIL